MQSALRSDSQEIWIENKRFPAAKCKTCGAKMYPTSLLKPHRILHRQKQWWFMAELKKLQQTIDHTQDIA